MPTPFDSEEEWRTTQKMMRAIGERLVLAGWASKAVDSDRGAGVTLTGKGIDGMDNLFRALKDLDPHTMQAEHIMGLFMHLTLRDEKNNPSRGKE